MFGTRHNPRFDLWGEMNRLQEEMNRIFAEDGAQSRPGPRIKLREDEHTVYAETDLPGVRHDQLDVTVKEGNQLGIRAERPAPEQGDSVWHRQERFHGEIVRTVTLPTLVDADKVEATLRDGVLKLVLPKSEAVRPRKIAVKSD